MLVCRDWEKAKKYGFKESDYLQNHLEKELCQDMSVFIRKENKNLYLNANDMAYDVGEQENTLDFLFDMIKDGVIEKVE